MTTGSQPVRAWRCPECTALISESVIGDPPDAATLVRCHECDAMVPLNDPFIAHPLDAESVAALAEKIATRIAFDCACATSDAYEAAWNILAALSLDGTA